MHTELFGTPLPHTVLGWAGTLAVVVGALQAVLAAAEKFLERAGLSFPKREPLGGLVLPVGWLAWSAALLYYKFDAITVLVVLVGSLSLLVVAAHLGRRS